VLFTRTFFKYRQNYKKYDVDIEKVEKRNVILYTFFVRVFKFWGEGRDKEMMNDFYWTKFA
jgi:hypothetical protein